MAASSKLRWYQFSIGTLLVVMTIIGASLALWQSHRDCMLQAEAHLMEETKWFLSGHFVVVTPLGEEREKKRTEFSEACGQHAKYHRQLKETYQSAAWRPWLRPFIDETPPPLPVP